MTKPLKTALISLVFCVPASLAGAQTVSTAAVKEAPKTEQPAKPAAGAPELNGYKQAAWGSTKDDVKAALHTEFASPDPKTTLTDLPWEIMRLAGLDFSSLTNGGGGGAG